MTQEEKDLLLKDLCARLPYGVKIQCVVWDKPLGIYELTVDRLSGYQKGNYDQLKPYLRPISSMTEEEKLEFSLVPIYAFVHYNEIAKMDWLNEHHFDYRGLIDKGLAFEVTEEYNPYKE